MPSNKKYLVTGGAGFIGSHLIQRLVNNEDEIICIDDLSSGKKSNLPYKQKGSIKLLIKKLQNINFDELENDIDGVFHLAAQTSVPVSINDFYNSSENNFLGMLKIWDFINKRNIPLVYASSSAVYGNLPTGNDEVNSYDILSPYAQDKLTLEDYSKMCFKVYNRPSIGLRFFNVYGPRQDPTNPYSGVISIFIDRLFQKKSITVNGGYQTRDFIYVDDITKVIVQSMEYLYSHRLCEFFNVGTGISVTINRLLSIISDIIKVEPEVILRELPFGDPEKSNGTYKKLKNKLNIDIDQFVRLEDGLKTAINYMREEKIK